MELTLPAAISRNQALRFITVPTLLFCGLVACDETGIVAESESASGLRGKVVDFGDNPVQGATIHAYYGFEVLERPARIPVQADSLLESVRIIQISSTNYKNNQLEWTLYQGAAVDGFKVYGDADLEGFPTKIHPGVLSSSSTSLVDTIPTDRPLEAVSYTIGVVLPGGDEVQFGPFSGLTCAADPEASSTDVTGVAACSASSLPEFRVRVFPTVSTDAVIIAFTWPTAGYGVISVLKHGYPLQVVIAGQMPQGVHQASFIFNGIPLASGIYGVRGTRAGRLLETRFFVNGGSDGVTGAAGDFTLDQFPFGTTIDAFSVTQEYMGLVSVQSIDSLRITHPAYKPVTIPLALTAGQGIELGTIALDSLNVMD